MITRADLSAAAWRIVERELSICCDCSTAVFSTGMYQGAPVLSVGHDPACRFIRRPRERWLCDEWIRGQLWLEGIATADYGDDLVGPHRVRK